MYARYMKVLFSMLSLFLSLVGAINIITVQTM